jgi:hypothetical protein
MIRKLIWRNKSAMTRKTFRNFFRVFLLIAVYPVVSRGQQSKISAEAGCPSGNPGVYVQGVSGWHLLAQTTPSKMKAKHAFISSLSYGAVGAPMVVEYPGPHSAVHIHATQPLICVAHIMSPNPPLLVRLDEKKKIRELDSGTIHAVPIVGSSKEAQAQASSIVPTTAEQIEDGVVLLRPQGNVSPGEYAVMFGAQNLAILTFGVAAGK